MEISFVGFSANFLAIVGALYLVILSLATALIVAGMFVALIASFMDDEFLNEAGIVRPEVRLRNETQVHLDGFEEFCEGTIKVYDSIVSLYQEDE